MNICNAPKILQCFQGARANRKEATWPREVMCAAGCINRTWPSDGRIRLNSPQKRSPSTYEQLFILPTPKRWTLVCSGFCTLDLQCGAANDLANWARQTDRQTETTSDNSKNKWHYLNWIEHTQIPYLLSLSANNSVTWNATRLLGACRRIHGVAINLLLYSGQSSSNASELVLERLREFIHIITVQLAVNCTCHESNDTTPLVVLRNTNPPCNASK